MLQQGVPRIVDHAARRQELAEALWRVVRRDGLAAVSVRTVALEAGTSPGSLRHYFATQDELLGFALSSVVDRATARIAPLMQAPPSPAGVERVLEEFLPFDEERREEVEVYLAFALRALVDPALRRLRDSAEEQSRAVVHRCAQVLADTAALGAGRSVDDEGLLLWHLIDGLALHGTLWPDRYPPAALRAVLRAHLDQLARPLTR